MENLAFRTGALISYDVALSGESEPFSEGPEVDHYDLSNEISH